MENHRSDLRLMDGKKYLLDQYFPSIKSMKKKKILRMILKQKSKVEYQVGNLTLKK